jgi:hypothetical protein
MTTIACRQLVRAPLGSAARFLTAFYQAHRTQEGEACLTLHAGDLAREARVTLTSTPVPGTMTPHYTVSWKDELDGPYPIFNGTIVIESDNDYNAFWLDLQGGYAPPGGLGGAVFDAIVGKRIAAVTAETLLHEIAVEIEHRFAAEETTKQHAHGSASL